MATGGRKPKPPYLRLIQGNPGKRPIHIPSGIESREGALRPHKKLTKAQAALWKRFIEPAKWITDLDAPKAYAWACLQALHDEKPEDFTAARLTQLRVLASELGLDPSSRQRMGVSMKQDENENDAFFD